MSKWCFAVGTLTPSQAGDGGSLQGDWMAIGGSTPTQYIKIPEVFLVGQSQFGAANRLVFGRNSIVGSLIQPLISPACNGPLDATTGPLPNAPNAYTTTAAAGLPHRASTAKLNFSLNAWGSLLCWQASPGEEWGIFGMAPTVGESSLSGYIGTDTGAMGAHIIYEVK
jgi:hypothetical protein